MNVIRQRFPAVLSTALLACTLLCSSPAWALDAKSLFIQARPSVVLVMSFDAQHQPLSIGSGFFVGNGKTIATNFHVIRSAAEIRIKLETGQVMNVTNLAGLDTEHDLALLRVESEGTPLPMSSRLPDIGEAIIALGNPRGLEGTLSAGIVSGIREEKGSNYYQITAAISPGSSGGPVLDARGEVLGISTFFVKGGQNLNFAMPIKYVRQLLEAGKPVSLSELEKISMEPGTLARHKADEKVKIIEPRILGNLTNTLIASVYNKNPYPIKNVRCVAVFFPARFQPSLKSGQEGKWVQRGDTPVHHMFIKVGKTVPPGLSVRFERRDSALENEWVVRFRVLDYEIIEGANTMPTFN